MTTPDPTAPICPSTGTRTEACACGTCARRKKAAEKYKANVRDVLALLDLIAGFANNEIDSDVRATWAQVGDAAHLRDRLMQIAMGLALRPDGDEQDARRRIEEALCAGDDEVGEALIDAL